MSRVKILVFLILSVFILVPSAGAADTPPPLSAGIDVLTVDETTGIAVQIKFTLTNHSTQAIDILKWGTPFDGRFTADCFDVRLDDTPVPYRGILVKRGAPRPSDYMTVAAGDTISATIDLASGYTIYQAGIYTIRYRATALSTRKTAAGAQDAVTTEAAAGAVPAAVQSDTAEFVINAGRDEPVVASVPLAAYACSAAQMNVIRTAFTEARKIAQEAQAALHNTPGSQRPAARRYIEWFGTYASGRYGAVAAHFDRIYDALMNKTITASCDNFPGVFAYVHPTQPYHIYFTDLFWSAPYNGTDSKAGTFVHELSHFLVVAGTSDSVNGQPIYGQTGCRNLARVNPDEAVKHADSHEYFAENTPPLPMQSAPPPPDNGGGSDDDDGGSGGCFIHTLGN